MHNAFQAVKFGGDDDDDEHHGRRMASNFLFSLEPTFTQGLILGQLSVFLFLSLILKYIFLDSTQTQLETSSYHPRVDIIRTSGQDPHKDQITPCGHGQERAEWLNGLLQQVRPRQSCLTPHNLATPRS